MAQQRQGFNMRFLIFALYAWGFLWFIVLSVCIAAYIRAYTAQQLRLFNPP